MSDELTVADVRAKQEELIQRMLNRPEIWFSTCRGAEEGLFGAISIWAAAFMVEPRIHPAWDRLIEEMCAIRKVERMADTTLSQFALDGTGTSLQGVRRTAQLMGTIRHRLHDPITLLGDIAKVEQGP